MSKQSLKFSRQEHWNGEPIPSPEDLPNPGIELGSPALQEDSFFFPLEKSNFFSQRANKFFLYCFKQTHFSIVIRNTEIYLALFQTFLFYPIKIHLGFLGGSAVKEFTCNEGDAGLIPGLGRSPGRENATHSSILAWEIPWTEEPGGLQGTGLQRSQTRLSN